MRLIKSTPKGKQRVYDIEVADVHNFYANGINVHNCATDGGVSVIKDDGTVVDLYRSSGNEFSHNVAFDDNNSLFFSWGTTNGQERHLAYYETIPSSDDTELTDNYYPSANLGSLAFGLNGQGIIANNGRDFAGSDNKEYLVRLYHTKESATSSTSSIAGITTSYNTGWMHGDIKGAFLSDTDATNVTVGSVHYTETFTGSGDNTWGVAGSATISGGVLTLANAADSRATDLTAASSLTTGQKYIAEIEIVTNTSQVFNLDDDGSGAGQGSVTIYGSSASGQTGTFLIAFTKTGSPRMRLVRISGGPATITSFKIYTAEEADRSVNNNGLKVFGTITKQPVAGAGATAAELVAYSGFNASNHLIQPYNSDLDFGTGDFSVIAWVKKSTLSTNHYVFDRGGGGSSNNRFGYIINAAGSLYFLAYNSSGTVYSAQSGNGLFVGSNNWRMIHAVRRGGTTYLGLDGVDLYSSTALNGIDITGSGDEQLVVGQYFEYNIFNLDFAVDAISLLRFSASAPSPTQIAKIYEDEKVLFQENSQATLYGSSDAVTALAYDEVNDLLHVGTSSGRSDFQGLRRINNTTTAVTTAISAYDSFVVEQ
jgi:trimeric autotransporter adhesin